MQRNYNTSIRKNKNNEKSEGQNEPDGNTGWALIPPWILTNPKLSATEKIIAGRIWGLSGAQGFCWMSNARLGAELGLSVRSISRIISLLNMLGYVKVELIRNEKKEIKQRHIYPLNPLNLGGVYSKMTIGIDKNDHRYRHKWRREINLETRVETTTTSPSTRPVVLDFENVEIKTPCLTGHKCNDFEELETVKKAIEIYKTTSINKAIKNPVGYICATCRKGAFLHPEHESAADQATRREAEKAAKAAEEKAAREEAAEEEQQQREFANLPITVKANYINRIKADMQYEFGEAAITAMAAAKWAQEAKYAK